MTLICVETKRMHLALRAIRQAQSIIKFNKTILFTDQPIVAQDCETRSCQINSVQDYSRFMVHDLHRHIDTEFVMVIQWDGFPLNAAAWDARFLDFDYIGAPWTPGYNKVAGMPNCTEETRVGNGGFSIRSKKLLDTVYEVSKDKNDTGPEDVYIARGIREELNKAGIKFAPYTLAERFSVEDNYYTGQFGFHGQVTIHINQFLKEAFQSV